MPEKKDEMTRERMRELAGAIIDRAKDMYAYLPDMYGCFSDFDKRWYFCDCTSFLITDQRIEGFKNTTQSQETPFQHMVFECIKQCEGSRLETYRIPEKNVFKEKCSRIKKRKEEMLAFCPEKGMPAVDADRLLLALEAFGDGCEVKYSADLKGPRAYIRIKNEDSEFILMSVSNHFEKTGFFVG